MLKVGVAVLVVLFCCAELVSGDYLNGTISDTTGSFGELGRICGGDKVGTIASLNWTLTVTTRPLVLASYDLQVYDQITDSIPCAKKLLMARATVPLPVGVNQNTSVVGPSSAHQPPWTYVIAVANCAPGGGVDLDYDFDLVSEEDGVWGFFCP